MFNHIIGQENVIKLLINDINQDSLHHSMIFHGEKAIGKLTAALEMVRILNCLDKKADDCTCACCKRIKDLNFEGFIFFSRRNFKNLIYEYILYYQNQQKIETLNQIKQITKLIFLSLQDFLIKDIFNETDKKLIDSLLDDSNTIISDEKISNNALEQLYKNIDKIYSCYKSMNIPVDTLRVMLDWSYISQPDINRVVIIDQVDFFEKASQNILLKRLEEPAKNLYFILLAENKNRILPTILSRCRCYYFRKLPPSAVNQILTHHFGESGEYNLMNEFLLRHDETSHENMIPLLVNLFNLVFLKEAPYNQLTEFINSINNRKIIQALLREFLLLLENEILRRQVSTHTEPEFDILSKISVLNLNYLHDLIKEKLNSFVIFNLNPVLLLEGIFYPLKTLVYYDQI